MNDIIVIKGGDLRRMRTFAGQTTANMAKVAGAKTRKTYENWEKGQGTPNVNQFIAMASFCGLNVKHYSLFHIITVLRKCGANLNLIIPELMQMLDEAGLQRLSTAQFEQNLREQAENEKQSKQVKLETLRKKRRENIENKAKTQNN